MKTLIAAMILTCAAVPASMAMPADADLLLSQIGVGVAVDGEDGIDRRSGRCPKRAFAVAREGSTCGGV